MIPILHHYVLRAFRVLAIYAILVTFTQRVGAQSPCTDNVPSPVITGKQQVCANEQTIYSTPTNAVSTWVWTLASGGQIVAANNNSVTIRWNYQPGTVNHKLSVREINSQGCSNTVDFWVSIKDITLRCIGNFNVSVDNTCKTVLNAEWLLLPGHIGINDMRVQILSGTTVLEEGIGSVEIDGITKNGVAYDFINKTFSYRIIESCSNNVCGGNVKFEDKVPPVIQCPMDIIFSSAEVLAPTTPLPQSAGTPQLKDCSPTSFSYTDELFETNCLTPFTTLPSGVPEGHTLPTTGDIHRIIVRTFVGSDVWGNISSCEQLIFIRRANVGNVICPSDVTYECSSLPPQLDPSVTGVPMFDVDGDIATTNDRFQLSQAIQMYMRYSDDTFHLCGGSYQITRTWTILSLCSPDNPYTIENESRKVCTQNITVLDKTPPVVNAYFTQHYSNGSQLLKRDTIAPFDGYYIINGSGSPGFRAHLYPISISDVCGGYVRLLLKARDINCLNGGRVSFTVDDARMKIASGYPQFDSQTGETTVVYEGNFMNIGEYVFTIDAKDECGFAIAKKTFRVLVRDNLNPQILALSQLTVRLDNNGIARVSATLLNNGSSDNCEYLNFEIKRKTNCRYPADTLYKPYIDFYCCDAGKSHQVQLKVSDNAGNFSEQTVNIIVDDNMKPTCYAPIDVSLSCDKLDMNNLYLLGEPALWDNCSIKDTFYSVQQNTNNCGTGTITRKWVIADASGNRDSCSQIITLTAKSDFTVDFPNDKIVDCLASVPTLEQMRRLMLTNTPDKDGHIINRGCGDMYVEVKDDTLKNVPDACFLILRTIRVIDWCQFNRNSSGNYTDGVVTATQRITIRDNIPPQYIACSDTIIRSLSASCETAINIQIQAQDACSETRINDSEDVTYTWQLVEKNDPNTVLERGIGNRIITILPAGSDFVALWTVTDQCGNQAQKSQNIRVIDTQKPYLQCRAKTAILTGGYGMGSVTVAAADMVQILSDNCSSESVLRHKLAIIKQSESGNTYPSVPLQTLTFSCEDVGKKIPVQIWTMDSAGNTEFGTTDITIEDSQQVCFIAPAAAIFGTAKTETGKSVANVQMSVVQNGNVLNSMMTGTNGSFNLSNLVQGQNYQVRAGKSDNPTNGVTTFDIALISRHLLSIQPFTSPYKVIAADVNKDGEVTAADMLTIRRLVLRSLKEFPNNASWRFVDKRFVFTDVENPFATDFPEVINLSNVPQASEADFVSIKVGDVNASVNPLSLMQSGDNTLQTRSNHKLTFSVNDIDMIAGITYAIPIVSDNFNAMGFQFTLNYTEGVEFVGIEKGDLSGIDNNNFGKFKNAITTSWNGAHSDPSVTVFNLVVKARKHTKLSEVLTIGSNITTAEAYTTNSEPIAIELKFNGTQRQGGTFALYQNEPNPFDSDTRISFNLPQAMQGKLTVHDATGRTVKTISKQFEAGFNAVMLDRSELNSAGVYYYRLETPTHSATKKMIVVN